MQVVPQDVHAMVRHIDVDGDGLVSFDEFRRALGSGGEDEDWSDELDDEPTRSGQFIDLKPIPMRELLDAEEELSEREAAEVPVELLHQLKAKVQKLEKFDEVWRSSGIASKHKVSIWDEEPQLHPLHPLHPLQPLHPLHPLHKACIWDCKLSSKHIPLHTVTYRYIPLHT